MIEKFSFDIVLSTSPFLQMLRQGKKEFSTSGDVKKKLILVKNDLESRAHVVMKLLAFMIYFEPRLQVETSAGMHYKPDLMIAGDHGVPELWIDCGKIALRKVDSLSGKLRASRVILVKETKRELETFRQLIEKKVEHSATLEYLAFDKGFVSGIADALARGNEVTLYEAAENTIGVALNQEIFESGIYR